MRSDFSNRAGAFQQRWGCAGRANLATAVVPASILGGYTEPNGLPDACAPKRASYLRLGTLQSSLTTWSSVNMRIQFPLSILLIRRTDRSGGPLTCWPYTGPLFHNGYGQLYWQGRNQKAHRLAFIDARGPIPEGFLVLHHCDNRRCCNPEHLHLGTHKQNAEEAKARGRYFLQKRGRLTRELVIEIRESDESHSAVANRLSVSYGTIAAIRQRRTWKHIE